jgi:hypothetical protein
MTRTHSLIAAALLFAACAKPDAASDTTAATAGMDSNAKAAMVSDAIMANPAAADSILKANGYTAESFQAEMFAISADSSRSAMYVASRSR